MGTPTVPAIDEDELRATVEALAGLVRAPGSEGEREAAAWIAARLEGLGCEVAVDEEPLWPTFASTMAGLSLAAAAAGLLALRGSRGRAALLAAAAAAGIAEDISNGPRLARRLHQRRATTPNVVARTGDPAATRTLVVLAHHDAAPTGRVFDPRAQAWVGEHLPQLIERFDTAVPIWYPTVGGPLLVALGALGRRRGLVGAGLALAAGSALAFADIARSATVPGANDNLTAVAALVALAGRLRAEPVEGLEVLLVSCGGEEALQEGMRGFARRHFPRLDPATTTFLNLETIGSPRLALLEGEGPLRMEDYPPRALQDRVCALAAAAGIDLKRNMRARSSTDSIICARAGYPTATLVSLDRHKALSNYHLPSDVPEHVRFDTVAAGTALAELLIRALAADEPASPR